MMLLLVAAAMVFSAQMISGYAVVDKIVIYALLGLILLKAWRGRRSVETPPVVSRTFRIHRLVFIVFAAYGVVEALRGIVVLSDVRILLYVSMFAAVGLVAWLYDRRDIVEPLSAARVIAISTAVYFALFAAAGLVTEWLFGANRFDLEGFLWSGVSVAVFPAYVGLPALALLSKRARADRWTFWCAFLAIVLVAFYYQSRSLWFALTLFLFLGAYWMGRRRTLVAAATVVLFLAVFPWDEPNALTPSRLWSDVTRDVVRLGHPDDLISRLTEWRFVVTGRAIGLLWGSGGSGAGVPSPTPSSGVASPQPSASSGVASPQPSAQSAPPAVTSGPAATPSAPPLAVDQSPAATALQDEDRVLAIKASWCTASQNGPVRLLVGTGYWTSRYELLDCFHSVAASYGYHFRPIYNTIVRTATINGMLVDMGLVGIVLFGALFVLTAVSIIASRSGPVLVSLASLGLIATSLFVSENYGLLLLYFALMPGGALLLIHPDRSNARRDREGTSAQTS